MSIRDASAFSIIVLILLLTTQRSQWKYPTLVLYGFSLGFLRRFLPHDSVLSQIGIDLDPLLLVVPLSLIVFSLNLRFSMTELSKLEKSILHLIFLAAIEILNPRQGSFLVGVAGWIAYAIPVTFIFLGKTIEDAELHKIMNSIKFGGSLVCVYGFIQVTFGYFPWDQRWFDSVTLSGDYTVLNYGTHRPFGTLNSVGEYGQVVGISAAVLTYQYLRNQIGKIQFFSFSLVFLVSSMLTASRSSLILTAVTILSVFVFRTTGSETRKVPIFRYIPVIILTTIFVPILVKIIPASILGTSTTLVDRQIAGLAGNNTGVSSAYGHISQTMDAFLLSIRSIFGFGVGAISGAQRFNGSVRMNFESDIGNAAYAFGILGLILMIKIFVQLAGAISKKSFMNSVLAILILIPSLNNWFNPGHYATVWLVWLIIGVALHEESEVSDGN